MILLEAEFAAEFEQCCAVTLEPVRGAVSDRFSLVYGPAPEEEQEIALTTTNRPSSRLRGDSIDIGEAVAQELSLALPDFPRDPEATIDEFIAAERRKALRCARALSQAAERGVREDAASASRRATAGRSASLLPPAPVFG